MRGPGIRRIALAIVLAIAALLAGTPATAQSGLTGTPLPVCVARAQPGDGPVALFRTAARFDCTTPQTDFGPGDYWVRSAPIAASPADRIRTGSLWQERATLHILYADGSVLRRAMDGRDLTRSLQLGAIVEQPIPHRATPAVRLLWHVEGAANLRGIVNGARLATPAESAAANLLLGTLYGGFAGLCIALLVYNLALWGALRHRFQLAYCAMLAGLLCYAASSSGALAWAAPEIANNDRLRINYLALAVSAAAALAFARSFFEQRIFRGWLARVSNVVIGLLVGTALLFVLAAGWRIAFLDRLYAGSFLLLTITVVPIVWQACVRGSNYLWLFAIAWAAPIALAGLRIAGNFNLVAWSFLLDNSTLASMAIEALLSSLAIAYRIRLLSRERDEAREQEIAARLLADIDPLTGLLNRRAFLREAIGRPGAQTLLLTDIDHFKRVNDTLGHDGGDEVLRIFARALRSGTPAGALVARLGGEEFAVLSDSANRADADELLARIRAERMPFDITVTTSIGVCTGAIETESDWKTLYRNADRALFEAKANGRDRVRHGGDSFLAA